jgi:hypothetical protein
MFIMILMTFSAKATKLVDLKIVDEEYLMLLFKDGDVTFEEDTVGPDLYTNKGKAGNDTFHKFGEKLHITNAQSPLSYMISSQDDLNFGEKGVHPERVHRKSKLGCMAINKWSHQENDYIYDWAYEHVVFLKLPFTLEQGRTYEITIDDMKLIRGNIWEIK